MRQRTAVSTLLAAMFLVSSAPGRQEAGDEARRRLKEAGRKAFEALRKEWEKPESHPQDVVAKAKAQGGDPARSIEFVRKEIRHDVYPGLQRGPAGVLVSGAGNSLDRAFLLAELLKAGGFDARLVRGTLPREKAEELVKRAFAARSALPAGRYSGAFARKAPRREEAEAVCKEVGVAAGEAARLWASEEQVRRRVWEDALGLAAREREFLAGQVRPAGRDLRDEFVESARAHAWVRWKAKDAADWRDADPVFDASPGVASEGELDPAKEADRFVLRLALDRREGDKRETVEVLRHESPVHQSLVAPLQFTILPTGWGGDAAQAGSVEESVKRLLGIREYAAIVLEGGRYAQSMVFDFDGTVAQPTAAMLKSGQAAKRSADLAAGAFGQPARDRKTSLESLWVDLAVTRGGKTVWTQRRNLLDPAARATWCPILQWNLLLQPHEFSAGYLRSVVMTQRVKNDEAVRARIDWELSGRQGDVTKLAQTRTVTYPVDLIEFCLARQAFLSEKAGPAAAPYFASVNLLMSGRQLRLERGPAQPCLCYSIDLVQNGALVLDAKEGGRLDASATMSLGAFDTVFEQALVNRANGSEPAASAVAFFERARAMSKTIRAVSAGDRQALAQAGVPAGDVEWILKNTDPGFTIVAAALAPGHCAETYAWWEIDPATGRTVGRLSGGRGGSESPAARQELAEYAELLGNAICFYQAVTGGKDAGAKAFECMVGAAFGNVIGEFNAGAGLAYTMYDLVSSIAELLKEEKGGKGGKKE